jgi:hypothetical protein
MMRMMSMPGFTANAALEPTRGRYGGTAATSATHADFLSPALVAPTVCRTSSCLIVGRCKTKVRCCRNFTGACTCSTVPCFFLGPPDTF